MQVLAPYPLRLVAVVDVLANMRLEIESVADF